jgi:hypothetical protein|tara:strand:+ start:41 stop:1129 length:1089 start_codon:yes stop_codon:yes gene_type:complete
MIKLYDLVFEKKEEIRKGITFDLGDKQQEFLDKLDLMSVKQQNQLIDFVSKLNDIEKKELGFLLNRFSDVKNLKPPKTTLEVALAKLYVQGGNIGPGEILFHLELEDSSMIGDTNHDLIVKGKVWEIKGVDHEKGGPFRTAKKGTVSKFDFAQNLYKMVFFLDKVTSVLPKLEDDFQDISPKLLNRLREWNQYLKSKTGIEGKFTPAEAIYQGEQSKKARDFIIATINDIKDEIKVNTDNEFTTVKFGGVNVNPTEKGIDPVSVTKVDDDDDSVTLNFIKDSTIKVLEILNELPYIREGDFQTDFNDGINQLINDLPNLILFSLQGKMLIVMEDETAEYIEFSGISQNNIQLKIKYDVWRNA